MSNLSVRWAFNFGSWKPTQAEILLATSCIQPEEKQRIAKFVFKKDFKASLIGRLLMRKFIASATKIPYNEITILRDKKDKPIFPSDNIKLDFNVSHHGDFTVLSGEIGEKKVGVDVMQIGYSGGKTLSEFFRIMNRQFSVQEWAAIKSSGNDEQQIITFCRNWSLKESYVKAIGVGITVNLQDITFKLNSKKLSENSIFTDTELFVKGEKEPWLFEETLLDGRHCVATAIYNASGYKNYEKTAFSFLTFDEIINEAVPVLESDVEYCNNYFRKND